MILLVGLPQNLFYRVACTKNEEYITKKSFRRLRVKVEYPCGFIVNATRRSEKPGQKLHLEPQTALFNCTLKYKLVAYLGSPIPEATPVSRVH